MTTSIKDVMTRQVQTLSTSSTVQEAAQKMKELDVGILPVAEGDRLLGTLSDRDITLRLVAPGLDSRKTVAKDIMSTPVVYCFEDQDVADAARIMESEQIRRLFVLNRRSQLVGVTSLGDLATRPGAEGLAREVLEKVSETDNRKVGGL